MNILKRKPIIVYFGWRVALTLLCLLVITVPILSAFTAGSTGESRRPLAQATATPTPSRIAAAQTNIAITATFAACGIGVVTPLSGNVNIRTGAGTNFPIQPAPNNALLFGVQKKYFETVIGWHHLCEGGWVSGSVTRTLPLPTPTRAPTLTSTPRPSFTPLPAERFVWKEYRFKTDEPGTIFLCELPCEVHEITWPFNRFRSTPTPLP